jgi:hypothetical protein
MQKTTTKTRIGSIQALSIGSFAVAVFLVNNAVFGAQLPVNLGTSANYVILAKSAISTVPPSAVTGNLGVSPISSTAITGFSLIMDSSGQFSTSSQVTGKVYAPDYATPTPVNLTAAVGDMQTAYADAAGRTLPDHTELGTGNIGGMTLAPGLYKWSTDVTIPTTVNLSGSPSGVWIFQIAGNLSISSSAAVNLISGAQSANIFWQVAGGVGVNLGTGSQFQGNILAAKGINLQTGASINGRLLAQTAVTLQSNPVTVPILLPPPSFGPTSRAANGSVTLSITNTPGLTLTLQTSTNLITWTTLSTPTPTNSPYITIDATASPYVDLFYRAFYP